MTPIQIAASDIERCLRRIGPDWREISIDPHSADGVAIYRLVRCGLAEVVGRYIAWHQDCNYEIWLEAIISGRWTRIAATELLNDAFDIKLTPKIAADSYIAVRISPDVDGSDGTGAVGSRENNPKWRKLTGTDVLNASPVDRPVQWRETTKRVSRLALFYSRAGFDSGTRVPVPLNSIYEGVVVQGRAPCKNSTLWNVAEFEPIDAVNETFATSSAIAAAFSQSCFNCSEVLGNLLSMGKRGEVPVEGSQLEQILGKSYSLFHHAGQHVLRMYHRLGRNCDHIAALVAKPLSLRNVDAGLLAEVNTVAALDMAIYPAPATIATAIRVGIEAYAETSGGPDVHVDIEKILHLIRQMGRSFETTPSTYHKFEEEELRDFILTHLNGHFEGGAASEQFRKHGKTDICIQLPGREAFITECKIWKGPSECLQCLDQILSYITPRDRHGAIVFFNKSVQNFKDVVIDKSAIVLRASELFRSQGPTTEYGEHDLTFRHKDDEGRLFNIRVFLFNLFLNPRSG